MNMEEFRGQNVTNIAVTVPCTFTEAQRRGVVDAGRIAKLNIVQLINEPAAAGMGARTQSTRFGVIMFDQNVLQLCFLKRDQNALKVIGVSGAENHGNSLSAIEFINQEMTANKFRLTNLFSVGDFSKL